MDETFKGLIAILVIVLAGVILHFIKRKWPPKREEIEEKSFKHQLKLDKEQKESDKQNILKGIEIIETVLRKWKVNLWDVGNEYPYGEAKWHADYPERFKKDIEEAIERYPNGIQLKLRDAIQPFYDDRTPDRDFARFKKRCQEVRENFAKLREEAQEK